MNNKFFNKEELEELLEEFCLRASREGFAGIISLVGGAAILLAYDSACAQTIDIDALYPHNKTLEKIILEISKEREIQPDWFNGAVEEFVPYGVEEAWVHYKEIYGVTVRVASAELLLAMKLSAGRPLKDFRDLTILIRLLEISSVDECLRILKKHKIGRRISEDTWDHVREILKF